MVTVLHVVYVLLAGLLICQRSPVLADDVGRFFQLFGYIRSVHQFAETEVCGSIQGKKLFFYNLKTKLCHLSDDFTVKFVLTLCEERSLLLDYWVEELYDMDGDGLVSFYENQHFYNG